MYWLVCESKQIWDKIKSLSDPHKKLDGKSIISKHNWNQNDYICFFFNICQANAIIENYRKYIGITRNLSISWDNSRRFQFLILYQNYFDMILIPQYFYRNVSKIIDQNKNSIKFLSIEMIILSKCIDIVAWNTQNWSIYFDNCIEMYQIFIEIHCTIDKGYPYTQIDQYNSIILTKSIGRAYTIDNYRSNL